MDFIHYLQALQNETSIYIQTHDFPDHDAVASAFGLQQLFAQYKIKTRIIYAGTIERDSLRTTIDKLGINIHPSSEFNIDIFDKIIIVDGCKGNKNVTNLIGDEIAVIDHHDVATPEDVWFVDIRPQYGSCSTLIYQYYKEMQATVSVNVANALLIGLQMDTALLTRGICSEDITAYAYLFRYSNIDQVNNILRNNLQVRDIDHMRYALNHVKIDGGLAFCYFKEGCPQNLMGIVGDFFMSLAEIEFAVVCALNDKQINFSLRSEKETLHAVNVINKLLGSSGFGGGHPHMAGGIMTDIQRFNEDHIFQQLQSMMQDSPGRI